MQATRDREKIPERAIDCEAHQGINSFARWARENLRPALRSSPLRTWDDVHDVCGRLGVVARPHGNGLVFEDATRAPRTLWKEYEQTPHPGTITAQESSSRRSPNSRPLRMRESQ